MIAKFSMIISHSPRLSQQTTQEFEIFTFLTSLLEKIQIKTLLSGDISRNLRPDFKL